MTIFKRANTISDSVRALPLAFLSSRTRMKITSKMTHTMKVICITSQGSVGHFAQRDMDL